MVFSSLLFVFVFLCIQLAVYFIAPDNKKNKVLLIFSLIFYSWGGPRYLLLLLWDTFVAWYFAMRIEENFRYEDGFDLKYCKRQAIYATTLLLGTLGIFKYLGFLCTNTHNLFGVPDKVPNIALPIGISFYTFQLLSYVIDVYRGDVFAQESYGKLLLYASLFHQCIAGPIVRYETVAEEIENRKIDINDVFEGVRRFSIGLAKKALLANSCASFADTLLPAGTEALSTQSTMSLWLGMIFYTLQIYLDFSAYSDMAIGMGRMVGFHYLENFNYPYIAKSVQDFWRRWHISLSSFFRDYVYIPLGGNRCSVMRYVFNMFVVWFLTGMWHGASWNYILWGLYYLVFLLIEKFIVRGKEIRGLNHVVTLFIVVIGWTIFKFENMKELGTVLKGMFFGAGKFSDMIFATQFKASMFLLLFCFVAVTPLAKRTHDRVIEEGARSPWFGFVKLVEAFTPAIMLFLATVALVGDSYNPFLYFQF